MTSFVISKIDLVNIVWIKVYNIFYKKYVYLKIFVAKNIVAEKYTC